VKVTHRHRRRQLLAALLTTLVGAGLASTLIAGMARADTTQNPPPCIPAAGYPNTPDTRKVGSLTAQEMDDLRKDILESIIFKETKGVATESLTKTSSGYQASYKSLVQTTEPTAITTLLRLPAAQLAGLKPNVGDGKPLTRADLQRAETVSDAAVFLWKGLRAVEWPNEKARDAADNAERVAAATTRDWFYRVVRDEDYASQYAIDAALPALDGTDLVFGRNEPEGLRSGH
jgi:hypothetical protein